MFCLGYLALAHLDQGEEARAGLLTRRAQRVIVRPGLERNWTTFPAFTASLTILARSGQRATASLAIGDSQTASALAETAHYHQARLPDAGTIKTQVASLYSKLNVSTRAQAVAALGIR